MNRLSSRARALVSSVLVSSLFVGSVPVASAADAVAPATSTPAVRPIDEVRLRDGSMVRGVIVERSSQGDVTMQLASGETRAYRKSDIEYAGPIGGAAAPGPASTSPAATPTLPAPAPAQAAPSPSLDEPSTSVRFESTTKDVRVHRRESRSTLSVGINGVPSEATGLTLTGETYRSLCVAPCSAMMPIGAQQVALGLDQGALVPLPQALDIKPGAAFTFDYVSNEGTRSTGKVLFWSGFAIGAASVIAGAALAASGGSSDAPLGSAQWHDDFDSRRSNLETGVAIGLVGGLIGAGIAIAGGFLGRKRDEASLHTADKAAPRPATPDGPEAPPAPAAPGNALPEM